MRKNSNIEAITVIDTRSIILTGSPMFISKTYLTMDRLSIISRTIVIFIFIIDTTLILI